MFHIRVRNFKQPPYTIHVLPENFYNRKFVKYLNAVSRISIVFSKLSWFVWQHKDFLKNQVLQLTVLPHDAYKREKLSQI